MITIIDMIKIIITDFIKINKQKIVIKGLENKIEIKDIKINN